MFSYYLFKDIVYDYLSQFEHRSVLTKFCVDDIMSHFALNFKSWIWQVCDSCSKMHIEAYDALLHDSQCIISFFNEISIFPCV
jgi:hypothetical protein